MKTLCVKLKPLASNKCTLVPASMKRIHIPLTHIKWLSAPPLPFHKALWTRDYIMQVIGKVSSLVSSVQPAPAHPHWKTGNSHDARYQHSV